MKPARMRCLRGTCKNRVLFRNDIAITCEGTSCQKYIRDVPEDIIQSIGEEYIHACKNYTATGYLEDFTQIQETLVQRLADAYACFKLRPQLPATLTVSDIKVKIVAYWYNQNMDARGRDMWDAMGLPKAEYDGFLEIQQSHNTLI